MIVSISDTNLNKKPKDTMIMIMITLSGGLQDAYTYIMRNAVFANAQTGNVVLCTSNLFHGQWPKSIHYFIPILSFAMGVLIAEQIHGRKIHYKSIDGKQIILLMEALFLFVSGLIPSTLSTCANVLISFCCALQVESFRSVNGCGYASTMCIGNLRSAMSSLSKYIRTNDSSHFEIFFQYITIIFFFAIGAGIGSIFTNIMGLKTIWLSSVLLMIAFVFRYNTFISYTRSTRTTS